MGLAQGSIVIPAQNQIVNRARCRHIHKLFGGSQIFGASAKPILLVLLRDSFFVCLQIPFLCSRKFRGFSLVQQTGVLEDSSSVLLIVGRLLDIACPPLIRRTHKRIKDVDMQVGIVLPQTFEIFQALGNLGLTHLMLPRRDQPPIQHRIRSYHGRLGFRSIFPQPLPKFLRMPHVGGIA